MTSWAPVLSLVSDLATLGRIGRALTDPTRQRILLALDEGPGDPAGVCSWPAPRCAAGAVRAGARAEQQQPGRTPGLVLAGGEVAGARPVGSGDDRPDRDEEHQRARIPAC